MGPPLRQGGRGKGGPAAFGLALKWRRAGGRSGSGMAGGEGGPWAQRGAGTARFGPVRRRRRRRLHAGTPEEAFGSRCGGAGAERPLPGRSGLKAAPPSWGEGEARRGRVCSEPVAVMAKPTLGSCFVMAPPTAPTGPGPAPGVPGGASVLGDPQTQPNPTEIVPGLRRVGLELPCLGEMLIFSGQRGDLLIGELNTRS